MIRYSQIMGNTLAVLVVTATLFAQDKPEAAAPIEKNKVGSYTITEPGVPSKLYLQIVANYGVPPDTSQVAKARSGKLKWLTDKGGIDAVYHVTTPSNYTPDVPFGILVYVNPTDEGGVPSQYNKLLAQYHLIGIGAEKSGNKHDVPMRHSHAVEAVELLRQRYNIDEDRVYISGMSGGGRLASHAMVMNADTFDGGIPMCGVNPCIPMKCADSKGNTYMDPGAWPHPNRTVLRQAAMNNRYVFATSEKDMNRVDTKTVYEGYKNAGFRHVLYLEQPKAGHAKLGVEEFEKAIQFLDQPLQEDAEKAYQQAQDFDKAGRLGQALEAYTKAALHSGTADYATPAMEKMKSLYQQYDKAKADLEKSFTDNPTVGLRALAEFRRDWNPVNKADLTPLADKLREARLKKQ